MNSRILTKLVVAVNAIHVIVVLINSLLYVKLFLRQILKYRSYEAVGSGYA